jgi:hypothetical protein
MNSVEVGLRRAAFGWPYYTAWNLAGYVAQRKGRTRTMRLLGALMFWIITTATWTAVWGGVLWLFVAGLGSG